MEIFFPHDSIRKPQQELVDSILNAIENKKNLLAHAPTGLGKTAGALAPALAYAIEHKLNVFFLTSRHTQHFLAIETLKQIKKKHGINFSVSDLIGKKAMCAQPGLNLLRSAEFFEVCKAMTEKKECEYYNNIKKKDLSPKIKQFIEEAKQTPMGSDEIFEKAKGCLACPYESATMVAKDSQVVVADYNYIFNDSIRESFFKRTGKLLEKSIVIVDEAHNLPERLRSMNTTRLTSNMIDRAIKEAEKYDFEKEGRCLVELRNILYNLTKNMNQEKLLPKKELIAAIKEYSDYSEISADLEFAGEKVREKQRQSYMGSIAEFLDLWLGPDEGYSRIIQKQGQNIMLNYKFLDPALVSKEIIKQAHSTILMSGTLNPTSFYRDLLGVEDCIEVSFGNPFPEDNRLVMVVPKTTTKFTFRNEGQYQRIAQTTAEIVNKVPGNCAVFFPSYFLRDQVGNSFNKLTNKTIMMESPGMTKEEKQEFLEKFKSYSRSGAVLTGVMNGSFSEGVDLPGDLLKCVVIVGLPLQKPDLEANQLIEYYDKKFARGWDYGYLYPAFNKSLQSAGRCIRSETDKGVIVFLDERYAGANYFRLFPKDMGVKITGLYADRLTEFFGA